MGFRFKASVIGFSFLSIAKPSTRASHAASFFSLMKLMCVHISFVRKQRLARANPGLLSICLRISQVFLNFQEEPSKSTFHRLFSLQIFQPNSERRQVRRRVRTEELVEGSVYSPPVDFQVGCHLDILVRMFGDNGLGALEGIVLNLSIPGSVLPHFKVNVLMTQETVLHEGQTIAYDAFHMFWPTSKL